MASQVGCTKCVKDKDLSYLCHDVTDVVNALGNGLTVSTDGYCPLCTIWEHLTCNLEVILERHDGYIFVADLNTGSCDLSDFPDLCSSLPNQ